MITGKETNCFRMQQAFGEANPTMQVLNTVIAGPLVNNHRDRIHNAAPHLILSQWSLFYVFTHFLQYPVR